MRPLPLYTQDWMNRNKPEEIHGLEGDCLNPKCDYEFNYNDQRKLEENGALNCPNCGTNNPAEYHYGEYPYHNLGKPSGGPLAGFTLDQMGKIGEDLVQELGSFPGIGQVVKRFVQKNWPIDFIIGDYGIEVKTNHSEAQPRFKVGGQAERLQKIEYCDKNALKPGLLGVRLNFYTDEADIFFRPAFTDTFVGAPTMRHIGTYNFAHLNPFKSPQDVPKLPDQSITDVDDVPFGSSDIDDLFGPDITKEGSQRLSFTPSGATYETLERTGKPYVEDDEWKNYAWPLSKPRYTYEGEIEPHTYWPDSKVVNAYSPQGELIGSAEAGLAGPNINFSQMYVHPDWRHTDVAFGLGKSMIQHFPGHPIKSQLEEPRLQHLIRRYNDMLGYDTVVDPSEGDEDEKTVYYTSPWKKQAMAPSGVTIQPAMDRMLDWKGNSHNPLLWSNQGLEPMNLIDQHKDIVGSFAHGDSMNGHEAFVPTLYIHPRYQNTDAAFKIFEFLRHRYPNHTFDARIENEKLAPIVERYNWRIRQQRQQQRRQQAIPGALAKTAARGTPLFPHYEPDMQYVFHMAPTEERNRIQTWGLMPGKPMHSDNWKNAPGLVDQPSGIYATQNLGTLLHTVKNFSPYRNKDMDVWAIPREQIKEHSFDPLLHDTIIIHHPVTPELYQGAEDEYTTDPGPPGDDRWMEELPYDDERKRMGIGLPNRVIGKTKTAMPWSNNVFYHVTDKENLPSIQKHGLQPRTFGDSRPMWRGIPVDEHSVYLNPDAGRAWDYRNTLEHARNQNRLVRPSYKEPAMLRISDIDRKNIWPDHEDFENYVLNLHERQNEWYEDEGKPPNEEELYEPHELHTMQMYKANNEDTLDTLRNMHPEHRYKVAEEMGKQGSRLMHHGPIHPRHIEVGIPNEGEDADTLFDRFHEENPDWIESADPENEDAFDEAKMDRLNDWMDEKGNWFGPYDPMAGQTPYEDWDESDPWGNHFTWKPLVKPTPAPANQMSLLSAYNPPKQIHRIMRQWGLIDDNHPFLVTAATHPDSFINNLLQDGGFTVHHATWKQPENPPQYIVALPGHERVFDSPEQFTRAHLNEMAMHAHAAGAPFIGGWHNPRDNKLYLDVSKGFDDIEEAMAKAREWKQKAIYDIHNGQEHFVDQWQ